jgi:hypothetical protein
LPDFAPTLRQRAQEVLSAPLPRFKRPAVEREVGRLREALGEEAFRSAWEAGRQLTLEAALKGT